MPKYPYAKPYDFVREIILIRQQLKQTQILNSNNTNSSIVQVDTSVLTNGNLSGLIPITASWGIDANDGVGTIYEVETSFSGTYENQTMTWSVAVDGAVAAFCAIGSGFFPSGTAFNGHIVAGLQVTSLGPTGTITAYVKGGVGITATRSSASVNATYLSGIATGITFDTTSPHTVSAGTQWTGSTAGQTITGFGSRYTRSGPQAGS